MTSIASDTPLLTFRPRVRGFIPNSGVPAEGLAKAMAHFYILGNHGVLNRFVWADVTRKALAEFYPDGDLPAPYDKPYR